ncbi:MAG TPA: hypothetical protein DCL41_05715 [Bdellovibrionales bacterium]|nr:hypothetical protein [Pseudobdellovibrionaceae bacterium]HAG91346.1 hypothetical protein [Bdellovibrionales bacterium]
MTPGKVSLLMNCYNGEKYVRQALESVFAQTYSNFEVLFVDNCSTDKSAEITSEFGDKVRILKTPQNMSLCKARVFARDFIDGEFFTVLDIDDLILPTKFEKQVQILQENPALGAVYCDTIYFKDNGEEVRAYGDKEMPSGNLFSQLLSNYFLSLETVMMRTSVMREHNLYFSEKYNVSSDMELFVKLSYFAPFQYLPEALAKWRHGHVTESITQYESFPREYEQLIEDLSEMIPDFKNQYASEIRRLRGVIENMYGVAAWKKGENDRAREHFRKALGSGRKYYVPFLMSHFVKFPTYQKMRSVLRNI